MLNCVVCGKELSGRQFRFCSLPCKTHYHSSYPKQKERGKSRKLRMIEIKGGHCSICGYDKCIAALHFHHRIPSQKSFELDSRNISNRTWSVILAELEKCDLLCSN